MRYFSTDVDQLNIYQRQIYYWNVLFDKRNDIQVLDNVNFSLDVYPEVLTVPEVMQIHPIEPGYSSPDASYELGEIIRRFEFERLMQHRPDRRARNEAFSINAGVGCAIGTTNVANSILVAIANYEAAQSSGNRSKPEAILALPNYAVYVAQAKQMQSAITPVLVSSCREHGFLPTFDDIADAVTDNTIAVFITYPNNPAQTTYEAGRLTELERLIAFCQEKQIFLVLDTIYQDLLFPSGRQFEEPFGLVDTMDYLVKVYGPSKDIPFFSGHRVGYWFGDPRLTDGFRFQVSSNINALCTLSMSLFGVSMLIKSLLLSGKPMTRDDLEFFQSGMFGWRTDVDVNECLDKLLEWQLVEAFNTRLTQSNQIQEEAIKTVRAFYDTSHCFDDFCNDNIGNVCFIRLSSDVYQGTDDELFTLLIDKLGIGIQPGNVFGVPRDSSDVWLRVTLTHDHATNVVSALEKIDSYFTQR